MGSCFSRIKASSGNVQTFCGVVTDWIYLDFVEASQDDVIAKSENGLLDSSQQEVPNLGSLKFREKLVMGAQSLLGRKFAHPKLQYEVRYFPSFVTEGLDGLPLIDDTFGSGKTVSPTEFLASSLKCEKVTDCCIAIPANFTYRQRKELLGAASMAKLTPHRLLHHTTAAVLTYRFSETDLHPAGELFNIAFVSMGYASMQVSIVELRMDQLKVLSHAYDESIGARAFIQVIVDHFSVKFNLDKSQMSLASLTKLKLSGDHSLSKLYESCRVLMCELSEKTKAELTYGTEKVGLEIYEFEDMTSELLRKVRPVLQKALDDAKLAAVDVHSVVLVGAKVPSIVNRIKNVFKRESIKTLRKSKPIATGCFIECAMLCLPSKFRKFQIFDILPYSIGMSPRSENESTSTVNQLVVFSKGSPFPDEKIVPLYQAGVFLLDIFSIDADDSEGSSKINTYKIYASDDQSSIEVKVKVVLDVHGLARIESAEVAGIAKRVVECTCDDGQIIIPDKVEKDESELNNSFNPKTENSVGLEKKQEKETRSPGLVGTNSQKIGNFTEFSLAELEKVTNNFDNSCKIGEGRFGSVYKGFLRFTNVAIKIPKSSISREADIQFYQEMEILTKVRHQNLVSLIGANIESRALIFEFIPNGSLDTFLTKGKESHRKLSWKDRIRIVSEICSVLIFLHAVPPHGFAHGDLKPENILLDSNLISKLTDFGISRKLYITNDTATPVHTTKKPKYTPAYCAPEFFSYGELTPRCDVYSFGIILLQLVTGTAAEKIKPFVEEARETGKFDKIVDVSASNWPIQEADKLASLGLWCSHPSAYERPDLAKEVWPLIDSMKEYARLH